MKWFDKNEFDKVRKLIDAGNKAKEINDWYWTDFRNNATTLAMAYIYAEMNGKCASCTKKLKSILTPKAKTGPLEYNDVVTEIWNHDNKKAVNSINILIDNNIPFQVKDGDVALQLMTNPALSKAATAIQKNPRILSKYMKKDQLDKIKTYLLSSKNLDFVKAGMSQIEYYAKKPTRPQNPRYRGRRNFTPTTMDDLIKQTSQIVDKKMRKRYIKEVAFYSGLESAASLFDSLLELLLKTDTDVKDVVDILSGLKSANAGNAAEPAKLFYHLHKNGYVSEMKQIIQNWDYDLWKNMVADIVIGGQSADPARNPIWFVEYIDEMKEPHLMVGLIPLTNGDEYVSTLLEKKPELVDLVMKNYPDRLPQIMKDVFIF